MHRHRAKTRDMHGYNSCVSPVHCNPASHGGITYVERCSCGVIKLTNSTGPGRTETTGWMEQKG